jgi:hypothetical protein
LILLGKLVLKDLGQPPTEAPEEKQQFTYEKDSPASAPRPQPADLLPWVDTDSEFLAHSIIPPEKGLCYPGSLLPRPPMYHALPTAPCNGHNPIGLTTTWLKQCFPF